MSLETRLIALAQQIAADVKNLRTTRGDLTALNTTEKTSLVGAINELVALGGGVSSQDVTDAVNGLRTELLGGASTAFDTFAELQAALGADGDFAASVATSLGLKVNATDVGNTDRNFVLDYTTARDS